MNEFYHKSAVKSFIMIVNRPFLSHRNWQKKLLDSTSISSNLLLMPENTTEDLKKLPRWDLSLFYKGTGDSKRKADMDELRSMAGEFQDKYRSRVAGLSPVELREAFEFEGRIHHIIANLSLHAFLSFASNTQDNEAQSMVAQIEELSANVASSLVFFDLEMGIVNREDWLRSPELDGYHYQIELSRERASHNLSEELESYSLEKNLTGRNALTGLFDEFYGQFRIKVQTSNGVQEFTEEEALASLHSSDREFRNQVYNRFLESVGENSVITGNIYNNIVLDHQLECKRRKYEDLMEPRNLSNQVSGASVRAMLDTVESGYDLARRYFRTKAKVLGITDFSNADIYAPLTTSNESINYSQAKDIVLRSYSGFHPRLGELTEAFFNDNRVDAALAPGKRSGAFCYGASPEHDAYVHLNYTGDIRSVQTLAHELGHGVHHQLSKRNNHTSFDTPLTTAETASVFGEVLLNEQLIADSKDPKTELSILASQMEGIIATVFRQTVLTRFEQRAHAERQNGRVSNEVLCNIWWEENLKLYGEDVSMIESYKWGWAYIPHFVHTPFYCYAYSYGQLLVLALYNEFKKGTGGFQDAYIELLSRGSSQRPEQLIAETVGLDITRRDFWDLALGLLDENLTRIENLAGV